MPRKCDMEKRGVIIVIFIALVAIFMSSCSQYLPVTLTICGDLQCGFDEENTCPSDCLNITNAASCTAAGGYSCSTGEWCEGYYMQGDWCCSETCTTEITEIQLLTGKNYLSLPYVELNDVVEDIIPADVLNNTESIYYYDCTQGTWVPYHTDPAVPSDPNFALMAGYSYVFVMAADDILYLSDVSANLATAVIANPRSPQNTPVCTGWNYVASAHGTNITTIPLIDHFWNIAGTYGSLWNMELYGSYSEIDLNYNHNLVPTYAYWLYVTQDGEIVP